MQPSTNGWGPIEYDHSNGEQAANDGKTLTLNGVTYQKGLGTHANSQIVYNLNGLYDTFQSVIGVDDEVGSNGRVVFQLFADGAKIYDSGPRSGADAGLPISVNVQEINELRLVVTDAGNGNAFDHADWADAKIILSHTAPYKISITNNHINEGGRERLIFEVNATGAGRRR